VNGGEDKFFVFHSLLYKYFNWKTKIETVFFKPMRLGFLFSMKFIRLLLLFAVTGKLWPKLYEIKVSPMKTTIKEGMVEQLCLRGPFNFS
jgi:hypothetical protein